MHHSFERIPGRAELVVGLLKLEGAGLVSVALLIFATTSVINRSLVLLFLGCNFVALYAERRALGAWVSFQHRTGQNRQLGFYERSLRSASERRLAAPVAGADFEGGPCKLQGGTLTVNPCALAGFAAILLVEVFRPWAVALGLVRAGLWVSVLECGVALVMLGSAGAGSARSGRGHILQRALAPLRALGRNSYELYLTHMFIVLWGTALFQRLALPPSAVPYWYVLELLCCVALGAFVARAYSAPLNRALRRRWLGRNESALAAAARATETAAAQD